MNSERVFYVYGEESDYDSHEYWVVAVWTSEEDAKKHLGLVANFAADHFFTKKHRDCTEEERKVRYETQVNPYDPCYQGPSVFDSGVGYGWEECLPVEIP